MKPRVETKAVSSFNFWNIFYLLTSRTEKIACRPPVFKPDFYTFSNNWRLRKIWKKFLYHTSLSKFDVWLSFHYNYRKEKHDYKVKLSFIDTDRLVCEIETYNVFEDFNMNKNILDFSKYADNSRFYDVKNKNKKSNW